MKNDKFLGLKNSPVVAMALFAGASLSSNAATTSIVETPDWLKVSGYAVASYSYTDQELTSDLGDVQSEDHSFFDSGRNTLDSVRLGFEVNQGPFKAYASLFYVPEFDGNAFGGGPNAGILDAYVNYKSGTFSVTAGKYLSWLGYEAFHAPNLATLTFANPPGYIPAYHTGIKFEYVTDTFSTGLNVSDSVLQGTDGFWGGDEDFGNGLGYEVYAVYKGIDKLTLFGGIAFDDSDEQVGDSFLTYDFWTSYAISDKMTIAGEIIYNESGTSSGIRSLLFMKYAFTEQFSTVFRVGYGDGEDDITGDFGRYSLTVAPAYAFNEHLTLRGEITYGSSDTDFANTDVDTLFTGIQAVLTF